MAQFNYAPDLFLEVSELNFMRDSQDKLGWRKTLLQNSVNFGLIKNSYFDPTFQNGYVSRDVVDGLGNQTIKINPLVGIDLQGNLLYSPNIISQIPLTNDGNWYWLKTSWAGTHIEPGTVSIAVNGNLVGVGTNFTQILRGQAFPTKIKFFNALYNVIEYEVLDVISDTQAVLSNPAVNISGLAEFAVETNLNFGVVGTFTPGVNVPPTSKYPFTYDSLAYQLVLETSLNTPPTFYPGSNFYLARINCSGTTVIIQDKRKDFWESKGSLLPIDIDRNQNPLVGVESIQWQVKSNPADKSIVNVAWGMRSTNWSINSSSNVLTIASGLGGKYKSVGDFNNGDFDGWRVYTGNGKYSKVITSVSVSGAINLQLDTLNVDDYSTDGGTTPIVQEIRVVPNCEQVEFWCQSNPADATPSVSQRFIFPVNDAIGRIELEVYSSNPVTYNFKYRYKSLKEYTAYNAIPTDTLHGYLTEVSFDAEGNLTGTTRQTYTNDTTLGFITLQPCPWSYNIFQQTVFIGDVIGVYTIPSLTSSVTYDLQVGVDKQYQYIGGAQSIASDTIFDLLTTGAVAGNEFRVHFNCSSLALGAHSIIFKSGATTIKTMTAADVYPMLNKDGGIILSFKFDDGGVWRFTQNYDLGVPLEIKMVDGAVATLFDTTGGVNNAPGKVKGLFGYVLCNHSATVSGVTIPNLSYAFILGQGTDGTHTAAVGDTGGEVNHQLITSETPSHNHSATQGSHTHSGSSDPHHHGLSSFYHSATQDGVDGHRYNNTSTGTAGTQNTDDTTVAVHISTDSAGDITIGNAGGDGVHNNMPPYYAVIYCKKIY